MTRILLPEVITPAETVTVTGEKAKYILSVLRCKAGDQITITDGSGNSYSAQIVSASRREVTLLAHEKHAFNPESPLSVTLLQGILKGSRMDFLIQKATELGAQEIMPIITERSQVRLTRKLPRWRKIAEEASRQSGRKSMPEIHEPVRFEHIFTHLKGNPVKKILFWEEGGENLSDVVTRCAGCSQVIIFTGPEGGFSGSEVQSARQHDFVTATLGRRILRAETAAIAALSIIQYSLGDLGSA